MLEGLKRFLEQYGYGGCYKSTKYGWMQQYVLRLYPLKIHVEVLLYLGLRPNEFRFWMLRTLEHLPRRIGTWCIIFAGVGFKFRLGRILLW